MKYLYISCILFCSLFFSCYKHEVDKYSRNNIDLGFSITDHSKGIILSWDQASMSSFVEYIIVKNSETRSAVEKISSLDPRSIFARINDRNIHSLNDSMLAFNSYYRLYINQGEQLISSDEILKVPQNYVLTSKSVNQILVDSKKGIIYFLNTDQTIEIVDLDKLEKINIYRNIILPKGFSCSLGYDKAGNSEIYIPIGDKINVFDGEKLILKRSITGFYLHAPILNTATDENSDIYYSDAIGDILGGIYKYDSETNVNTKIRVCDECNHVRFKMSRNGKRGLLTNSGSGLVYFTLNDKYQIDTTIYSSIPVSWISDQLFVIAERSQTLICGNSGSVFNLQFKLQKQLANDIPGYVQSIFDEEENFIYSIGSFTNEIVKFENKPGYQKLGNIVIKSTPLQIFIYKGSIFVLGSVFDPSNRISKLILEEVKL